MLYFLFSFMYSLVGHKIFIFFVLCVHQSILLHDRWIDKGNVTDLGHGRIIFGMIEVYGWFLSQVGFIQSFNELNISKFKGKNSIL